MKKILSVLICVSLIATSVIVFAACSKNNHESDEPTPSNNTEEIVGGWSLADSPVITDAFKKVFAKAMEERTGVTFTPVAYIGSQVVAGTNHCVLCKAEPVVPNPKTTYAIVYIYEDLDGNAEVTDVLGSDINAQSTDADGGWADVQSPELTKEAKKALDKACETLTGAEYTPVALLATQVVGGMNYRILCNSKPSIPSDESKFIIVTVYADLEGNAEITQTEDFETPEK